MQGREPSHSRGSSQRSVDQNGAGQSASDVLHYRRVLGHQPRLTDRMRMRLPGKCDNTVIAGQRNGRGGVSNLRMAATTSCVASSATENRSIRLRSRAGNLPELASKVRIPRFSCLLELDLVVSTSYRRFEVRSRTGDCGVNTSPPIGDVPLCSKSGQRCDLDFTF